MRDLPRLPARYAGLLREGPGLQLRRGPPRWLEQPARPRCGIVRSHFFGQSSFASHCLACERNVVKVREDVPLELLGPLGCGIQAGASAVLNTAGHPYRRSIAVFGTGSVGLSAVLAAVAAGYTTIIGIDTNPDGLKLASELGATHVINAAAADPAGEQHLLEQLRFQITEGELQHPSRDSPRRRQRPLMSPPRQARCDLFRKILGRAAPHRHPRALLLQQPADGREISIRNTKIITGCRPDDTAKPIRPPHPPEPPFGRPRQIRGSPGHRQPHHGGADRALNQPDEKWPHEKKYLAPRPLPHPPA